MDKQTLLQVEGIDRGLWTCTLQYSTVLYKRVLHHSHATWRSTVHEGKVDAGAVRYCTEHPGGAHRSNGCRLGYLGYCPLLLLLLLPAMAPALPAARRAAMRHAWAPLRQALPFALNAGDVFEGEASCQSLYRQTPCAWPVASSQQLWAP